MIDASDIAIARAIVDHHERGRMPVDVAAHLSGTPANVRHAVQPCVLELYGDDFIACGQVQISALRAFSARHVDVDLGMLALKPKPALDPGGIRDLAMTVARWRPANASRSGV